MPVVLPASTNLPPLHRCMSATDAKTARRLGRTAVNGSVIPTRCREEVITLRECCRGRSFGRDSPPRSTALFRPYRLITTCAAGSQTSPPIPQSKLPRGWRAQTVRCYSGIWGLDREAAEERYRASRWPALRHLRSGAAGGSARGGGVAATWETTKNPTLTVSVVKIDCCCVAQHCEAHRAIIRPSHRIVSLRNNTLDRSS